MLSSFVCPKLRSASSGCSAWQPASEATSTIASTSSVGRTPVAALNRNASEYSRYGSTTHKQVYIYGGLDTGATEFNRDFGMAWGIGGWLLFPFLQKIGPAAAQTLKQRVAAQLKTTFASRYAAQVSLAEALQLERIAVYGKRATGAKYLINPNKGAVNDSVPSKGAA